MTLTREEIMDMEPAELGPVVAEHIFQAKVIGKENFPELSLLVGWFGKEAWKPMKGTWHNAEWRTSEERAWLDCPRFGEEISAAWEIEEQIASLEKEGHYVKALCDVVGTPRDGTRTLAMDDWRMLHAKPEQRCKAALIAVLNL